MQPSRIRLGQAASGLPAVAVHPAVTAMAKPWLGLSPSGITAGGAGPQRGLAVAAAVGDEGLAVYQISHRISLTGVISWVEGTKQGHYQAQSDNHNDIRCRNLNWQLTLHNADTNTI